MPEVASATLTVTPVLSGAQQSLTEQLTGEASAAGDKAGQESGKKFSGGMAKAIIGGTAAVTGAVVGVGAALVSTAGKTAEYGDQIDKASQKLGVSSTFYQEWDAVLQHSGTSMDSMSATFKKLASASQDASKDQQAAFEALGLSMDQVANMSTEDLFTSVISGLQGMEEGTERTALATTLLGRGAMEMGALLNTSAEDTQGMIDTVHELGGVMGEDSVKAAAAYQDALQDMQTSFAGIKNGLMADLMPVLSGFMNNVADFIANTDLSPLTDTIGKAVEALGKFISGLDIEAIGATFQQVISGIGDVIETVWGAVSQVFDALKKGLATVSDAVGDTGVTWDDVWGGIASVISTVAGIISQMIGVIASAIAWLVTEAQTDGTLINTVWEGIKSGIETLKNVISGVVDFVSALLDGDWAKAWESAKNIVSSVTDGIRNILGNVWEGIKNAAANAWEGIKNAITGPIESAKNTISGIIERIKGFFPLSLGKIFSGIQLPHFNISGGKIPWGIGGMGERPSVSIDWYARAAELGARFTQPQIIGVGDASQPEILLGEDKLRDLVGGKGVTNYITVNGTEDPEAWAAKFAKQMKIQMRMA